MDIAVSALNNRMTLQIPAELPLGLVFVVGRVTDLRRAVPLSRFFLADGEHRLHCWLPSHVIKETLLEEGDRVRVGGELQFDPRIAAYRLLARDLEILPPNARVRRSVRPILEDLKRRAEANALVQTELPRWVQEIAPEEVRAELALAAEAERKAAERASGAVAPQVERATEAVAGVEAKSPSSRALPPEMVAFLSSAIDSDEEIELTPEMIAEYLPDLAEQKRRERRAQTTGEIEITSGEASPSATDGSPTSAEALAAEPKLEAAAQVETEPPDAAPAQPRRSLRTRLQVVVVLLLLSLFIVLFLFLMFTALGG
ncbi:MAG: OB-fold nucleic acid binding domain-containing protein [Candidatus Promineifilaceae bacterium]|nr:OB-fold nucleic acid binding domain-containing protein [Candidatus Promineifilaceae bacterium]